MSGSLLRVVGLSKTFAGNRALDGVSLVVGSGEVVAVVGHNGSGKSTLVKCLAGVHSADPGGVVEVSQELHFVHQDLGLVGLLSTVENLGLGSRGGVVRDLLAVGGAGQRRRAHELVGRFGGDFDVSVPVGLLSPAERAIVAIARALDGWDSPENVLILDEPTTAFNDSEVRRLFDAVRRVAAAGAGVVFISHRLDEVLGLADRVVALRDGRVVADAPVGELDHEQMVALIAGRAIAKMKLTSSVRPASVMGVAGLAGGRVRDIGFSLHAGEIVGVSGLLGSGREEVASMLFGARPRTGFVTVAGNVLPAGDMAAAIRAGVGFVPADRKRGGAVMDMSVRENLTLPLMRPLRRWLGRLDVKAEKAETHRWTQAVKLSRANPEQPLRLLSGGNQQKVVLARWLRTKPSVLLLDEPTQGVDVGAKASIYELIAGAAHDGAGVLVCSSDPEELVLLCDRVLVIKDGRVASEILREDLSEARLVREELAFDDSGLTAREVDHG